MSQHRWILAIALSAASLLNAPVASAQFSGARGAAAASTLAPSYQEDYGYWREQVRVASPSRNARWDGAPRGAVRVYHRRFDTRWNWRSAPRHRVVYTYHRGDLWFLDPTTGWAYSVDQYGIVYTADPYRGWVYSLGPLTRWTADLLYFFDLYRFDRGYWYCADYDYFVDLWEINSRRDFHAYDTAYAALWGWEPYWRSPTFISFSINFTTVWVGQVRRHYDYIERNPHYRRELLDSIGLPAVQATPPRQMSPRAVATTAYWEARDLAAAGFAPPPRGRDTGRSREAGTLVDTRDVPSRVVDPGAPAPGFNAPFPDGRYSIGAGEGEPKPGGGLPPPADRVKPDRRFGDGEAASPPQFEAPAYTPREKPTREDPAYVKPRYEKPAVEQPRYDKPAREEPRYEKPAREEPRYEKPAVEQPRYDKPAREQPRYEKPAREEPRYDKPAREEPRYDKPAREQPRDEKPAREEPKEDRKEERSSSRSALAGLGVSERED
jgi:hypothetical protein